MNYKAIIAISPFLLGASIFGFSEYNSEPIKCGTPHSEEVESIDQTGAVNQISQPVSEQNTMPPKFYVYGYPGITLRMGDLDALEIVDISGPGNSSSWWSVSERSMSKTDLLAANTMADLMYEDLEHSYNANNFSSAWIKTQSNGQNISLMSDKAQLNDEIKSLFKSCGVGTDFEIVVNYSTMDPETQQAKYERMNVNLSVVPEKEAEFAEGYKALLDYFENRCSKYLSEKDLTGDILLRIKFTINTKGEIDQVILSRESGKDELDTYILTTLKHMPAWIPAENAEGEKIEQSFELVYANVIGGC